MSDSPCLVSTADIGKPDFKLEVSEDKKKITLHVTDPLTAVFKDGRQLNIRDIFSDDLQYLVTYRKSKSTGKVSDSRRQHFSPSSSTCEQDTLHCTLSFVLLQKEYKSKASEIELTGLDKGESYCFNVQAYIPSRRPDKQKGEMSHTQCSSDDDQSLFEGECKIYAQIFSIFALKNGAYWF